MTFSWKICWSGGSKTTICHMLGILAVMAGRPDSGETLACLHMVPVCGGLRKVGVIQGGSGFPERVMQDEGSY